MKKDRVFIWVAVGVVLFVVCVVLLQRRAELKFEERKYEEEQILQEENRRGYLDCVLMAEGAYSEKWDSTCVSLGRAKDCLLPGSYADSLNESLEEAKEVCKDYFNQ